MDYAPFPLIELTGGPRERGRQHGQAVPDRQDSDPHSETRTIMTAPAPGARR